MSVENHRRAELALLLWVRGLGVVPDTDCAVQASGDDGCRAQELRGLDAGCVSTLGSWDGGREDGTGLVPDSEKAVIGGGEDAWVGCKWRL